MNHMDKTPGNKIHAVGNDINFLAPDECWFSAPAERTPLFLPVFLKVSRALHQSLRETLAPMLFSDLQRLANIQDGYPLLFYHATRPYHSRTEFYYDVLDAGKMDKFFRLAKYSFRRVLSNVWAALKAAGLDDIAKLYWPGRADRIAAAVRTQVRLRRRINQMLVSEARLLTVLIELGGADRCPAHVRVRKTAEFIQEWNIVLRRFYSRRDFTAAGPVLLRAATVALITAQRRHQQDFNDDFGRQAA
jgi:hypothetical protein